MNDSRTASGTSFGAVVLVVMTLALGGCGPSGENQPSQVVARVDGHEITIAEVNAALANVPPVAPANAAQLRQQIIQALVDQQLELDAAKAHKLDQTPDVLLQMELARREVLANAYLRQVADTATAPSDAEIHRYYESHPDLFAQRKIYQLHELTAQGDARLKSQVDADVSAGQSLEDIATTLKAKAVSVVLTSQTLPAERISLEFLPQLAALAPGGSLVTADSGVVRILKVVSAQPEPIDETHALPLIRRALLNKARKAAIAKALQRLETNAKIEYLGSDAPSGTPPTNIVKKGAAGLN